MTFLVYPETGDNFFLMKNLEDGDDLSVGKKENKAHPDSHGKTQSEPEKKGAGKEKAVNKTDKRPKNKGKKREHTDDG